MTEQTRKPSVLRGIIWTCGILFFAIPIVTGAIRGCNNAAATHPVTTTKSATDTSPKAGDTAADKAFNRKKGAAIGVVMLKSRMRNPDSFQLVSVLAMPKGRYCYEYRAQNGFGGMNVENAVLYEPMILTTDHAAWNKYCARKTGIDLTDDVESLISLANRQ